MSTFGFLPGIDQAIGILQELAVSQQLIDDLESFLRAGSDDLHEVEGKVHEVADVHFGANDRGAQLAWNSSRARAHVLAAVLTAATGLLTYRDAVKTMSTGVFAVDDTYTPEFKRQLERALALTRGNAPLREAPTGGEG
ncbi:hypothetical protein [Nocardioides ferulae]|uniref:hypothetical protein n=1 Tax=Nocardioides ferulae TaxID=2340821 RepID=UPI000EAB7228|nr:hypothetical protein [Nocardioides ferulae]